MYNQTGGSGAQDLSSDTYGRVGVKATSITAGKINEVTAKIRVNGTHTSTNVVYCRVRSSDSAATNNDNVIATASKTIAQLTGGGTATEYTFTDFTGSGVTNGAVEIQDGYHVLLEYPYPAGGSNLYLAVSWNVATSGWSWVEYGGGDGSSNTYVTESSEGMLGVIGGTSFSNLPENTIFNETDTYLQWWLQDGSWLRTVDTTDLKAYWRFNETSGSITNVATTYGSGVSLGSDADLTANNSPTYDQTGSPTDLGNSVLFDGSNDYCNAGTSVSQFNFLHNISFSFLLSQKNKFSLLKLVNLKKLLFSNHFNDLFCILEFALDIIHTSNKSINFFID